MQVYSIVSNELTIHKKLYIKYIAIFSVIQDFCLAYILAKNPGLCAGFGY